MRDDKGKTGMQPKKNLILFILISFAIHMQGKSPREEVLAIHLNDPPENTNQSPEGKEEPKTAQSTVKKNTASHRSKREATVDLGSIDLRYTPYL
jgi:hypothetical protein